MTRSAAPSTASADARWRAGVFAAALACFAVSVTARGWIRDDRWLVADNALLRRGAAAVPAVLTTGYVETARGSSPIEEWRPLLSLSYLAQLSTTGRRPAPFHAVDVLLHAAVCALLFSCLRRGLEAPAAGAAALLFAVAPVHAEAVAYIASRAELLAALSLLFCWRLLGAGRRPRLLAGLACYAAGLLSKESAAVIPAFLALEDWVFEGALPWSEGRGAVYGGLAAVTGAWLAARARVLPRASAGVPFFASRLDALLVWPGWALRHYAWPALSGLSLCADFSRAGAGLSASATPARVLAAAALTVFAAAAAWGLARRARWAFWAAAPLLFLLPTLPLLVPLDTIGAERFLYLPFIAPAVGFGWAFARLRRRHAAAAAAALSALTLWYGGRAVSRALLWTSPREFYAAACGCDPASARARVGLGEADLEDGKPNAGRAELERAAALDPALATAPYELALLAYNRGRAEEARTLARRAAGLDAGDSDAWVLLGLAEDQLGARAAAEAALRRAVALVPYSAAAQLDLGRVLLETGRHEEGLSHLRRFVDLAPEDPEAPRVAAFLRSARP